MTIKEYIKQKFQTFGIQLSEADILDISLSNGLNVDDEVASQNHSPITVVIVEYIPNLLLRASSFTENKLSMSWDTNSLKSFYSLKCKEYGMDDLLNEGSTVTLW